MDVTAWAWTVPTALIAVTAAEARLAGRPRRAAPGARAAGAWAPVHAWLAVLFGAGVAGGWAAAGQCAVRLTVTEAGRQSVLADQATNGAVALSMLPARQRRSLAAAVPALDALARAVGRLAYTPGMPAGPVS